jgi:hypothetical protein
MKEINDEIKLTLNLMQTDIDDGAHGELQSHLYSLLEIKRNKIQNRLALVSNGVDTETDPWCCYLSGIDLSGFVFAKNAKPLTAEELKSGGWWCADNSDDALKAFILYGLKAYRDSRWDGSYYACFISVSGTNFIDRGYECHTAALKQIHRISNEFYWSEK